MEKADHEVRGELSRVLEEYGNIFLEKLPYGPPPRRIIDHETEVAPGLNHCIKALTGSATQKWRN